jgi:hypothetical protein
MKHSKKLSKKTLTEFTRMIKNMETHLKSKGFKCQKVQINIEPENEEEKEDFIPIYNLTGEVESETENKFNYIISISDTIQRKDNGKYQVLLQLETEKDNYITFYPKTNAQLEYFITFFEPGNIKQSIPTTPEKPEKEKTNKKSEKEKTPSTNKNK